MRIQVVSGMITRKKNSFINNDDSVFFFRLWYMDYIAIIAIIIVVITVLVLKHNRFVKQSGGAVTCAVNINPLDTAPAINRQIKEIQNTDCFLSRDLLPNNKDIENLLPKQTFILSDTTTPRIQEEFTSCPSCQLNFSDIDCDKISPNAKILVESNQPFFLESPYVIGYYGKNFYFDSRYPREPIHVSFLENESKYVQEHPQVYPSYVIQSRNYSNLEPSE